MGKFRIIESENGLDIEVCAKAGKKEQLLSEFQNCQQGECSCPTEEYKKLDSMAVEITDERIHIHLIAKESESINKSEIARCLEHTTQKAEQGESKE